MSLVADLSTNSIKVDRFPEIRQLPELNITQLPEKYQASGTEQHLKLERPRGLGDLQLTSPSPWPLSALNTKSNNFYDQRPRPFAKSHPFPCSRAAVMSFKKFRADVATAAQKAAGGGISGVLSVTHGDSDGEVVIRYHHENLPEDIRIQALAQNVTEYPDGNTFLVWTDDHDPLPPVVAAVKTAQDYLLGLSVYEMVMELAKRLENAVSRPVDGEDGSPSEADETSDDDDDYDAAYDADYPSDGDEVRQSELFIPPFACLGSSRELSGATLLPN